MKRLQLVLLVCHTLIICRTQILPAESKIQNKHNCIEVGGELHKKEVLANGLNRPYQLAYYKDKKDIFFSQNIGNDTEDKFEIRCLQHNTTSSELIKEKVENGFALALDEDNHVAYFGGSNGIFKRWLKTGNSVQLVAKYNIWDSFFKNRLYFISFPKQKVYELNESELDTSEKKGHDKKVNKTEKVQPKLKKYIDGRVLQFAIDGDDDIFITNSTGLYMIKNGTKHPIMLDGATGFRALEINNKGDAYFAGKNEIFVPHKHNHTLHKIADVKNIFGLTFDSDDHIIYSDPLEIVKLVPSDCTSDQFVPIPIPT